MASFRKIVRRPAISEFRQGSTQGGGAMLLLAGAMDTAYKMLEPAAAARLKETGAEAGSQMARDQIGASPRPGGGYRDAIAAVESGGRYDALGPMTKGGDRAYGKYQVMGANIGPWTQKHLGRTMTPGEFLKDTAAQDAVFDGEFGSYVARFGNVEDAASMWFSGKPMAEAGNASDGYNTVPEYVSKVVSRLDTRPTTIKTPGGKTETRLYSPMSGPLLQVHNAAAGVAYLSGIQNKAAEDFTGMQNQFLLDPGGFRSAADEYVQRLVSGAPKEFRADLRASLEREAQQAYLGVLDNQQRDIRQRAANGNQALIDRKAQEYATALAQGDETAAASALSELDGALKVRQSLPGLAFTEDQAINVKLDAEAAAQRIMKEETTKLKADLTDKLKLSIEANKAGLSSANDGLINDPMVQALLPDLVTEAAAQQAWREGAKDFFSNPPSARKAQIEAFKGTVTDSVQIDILKAATVADKLISNSYAADPVAAARKYAKEKPADIPDPTQNPQGFVTGLAQRVADMKDIQKEQELPEIAFLDKAEAAAFGAILGKGADPGVKLAAAAAIVQGAGADAASVFRQMNVSTPTMMAGMLMARGGSPETAKEIVLGEHLLESRAAQPPTSDERKGAVTTDIKVALAGLPDPSKAEADAVQAATAIWAANGGSMTMEDAVQKALGRGADINGNPTGGVDTVAGHPTLLPVGVSGAKLDKALRVAFGIDYEMFGAEDTVSIWARAGSSVPMKGGQPVPDWLLTSGKIVASVDPSDPAKFRLTLEDGDPLRDMNGNPFTFYPEKLIEAAE